MAALLLIAPASRDDPAATALVGSLNGQRGCDWRLAIVGRGPRIRDARIDTVHSPADVWMADHRAVGLVDLDWRLEAGALGRLLTALDRRPDAAAVYGDERRGSVPLLRPGWSPETIRSRTDGPQPLLVRPAAVGRSAPPGAGGADRHQIALDLVAADATVLHLPEIVATTTPTPTDDALVSRVDDHLRTCGVPARATTAGSGDGVELVPAFGDPPSVSVVIPSAGRRSGPHRLVTRCIRSLAAVESHRLEIIVVTGDEYDGDPCDLTSLGPHHPRVVSRGSGAFSFARAINSGALAADNDLLVLLNDDTIARDGHWLSRLAVHAVDPRVGAVGATLLYPDDRIQHVGMVIDDARPLHPFVGRPVDDRSVRSVAGHTRTLAAVTGACLMVERSKFLEVGGLSCEFPMSFNDVDLCFKLARQGHRTVHEPGAVLIHDEGATRRSTIEPWEWDRFVHRWGSVEDPWYHPAYLRAGDPADPRGDADHVLPDLSALARGDDGRVPVAGDTTLRPTVHHSRPTGPVADRPNR